MDELRRACAEVLGYDPETWPSHGNASLAIASALALRQRENERLRALVPEWRLIETVLKVSAFRHFDGMCWPVPGERLGDCAHALVWDNAASKGMKEVQLVGASVIEAYAELIRLPERKRNAIIRELRKGSST